ncbi:ABC transporter ATP-binding protein [Duganella violaceipulchra]|uniref:ABC transporter ATP-binding protein/permease n=1 Tax=Duganella violaceipulchra TaxID=2849652 RepID=A0AA41HBV9_9BURK|nr:ABC transporter ATP-binding protein [Duganella violaceicalia]MBV6324419.1 ABC transporter ATP-binding protein/permease [Duganella violaceicalia]MCP2012022.1 ATP-binding cassette subfamily B protein [Duganella violaceicalia]
MTTEQLSSNSSQSELPERWRSEIQAQLSQGENVVSALEVDLDEQLRFAKGIILVTERGVLARAPGRGDWQRWPFAKDLLLKHHDHAGVGHLELIDDSGRLAAWRFTLGQNLHAIRLVEQFGAHRDSHALGVPVAREEKNVCPSCKAPLEPDQEECPICTKVVYTPPSTWTLFRLWRFAKPYKLPLGFGFALMLLSTGAHMIPPYLTIPLMDKVLIPYQNGQPVDASLVALYMSGLVASAVLAWVLGWGKTYVLALVSERIGADLRTETYDHLLRLSLEYFGGKRTGDLMSRIGSESDRICVFLSLHLLDFASDCLMIIMTGVILFSIDPWLAIFTLLPLPFIAWLIHVVRDRLRTGFEKIDRVWGEVTNVLADTIPGIRVVKAFAQESREASRFRTANKHNLAVNDKLNKIWSLFSPTVSFLTELGLLVIWVFGIYQVSKGHITVGVLSAFIAYSSRFYGRLDSMSRIVSVTQKSASAAKRIFDILDHVSSVPEPVNPVKLAKVDGNITLREVGFRYGNRAVNRGISLDIKAGEMIGLVGHSGSGKSTLVNLICRFYDVSEGAIMLDGVDIRSFAVSDYRRNIGLVLQEPFLFFGTIAENLAYGKPEATRAEIIAAARAAHAHEFILRLPQGYDSMVGERGQGLSGGERQRISIARALLIDPKILILDEATSSVDSETEKEIQRALENLVQGRTTIAIAHRLSTLQKADRLVVLDRGVVVEEGPHDDLMAREGAYFRLYQAQARNVDTDLDDSAGKE